VPQTWILTGSPENHAATRDRGYTLIGMKERRRRQALEMEPGDRIILYATRVMAFAASLKLTGEMFEDRTPVWPGKPGKADPYPWRFESEPELVLPEDAWLPAEDIKDELEHIRKWPAEHWKLAFQGPAADGVRGRRPAAARRHGRPAAAEHVSRLDALRGLPGELKLAGVAAAALGASLILPWYQKSFVPEGSKIFVQQNVSAFGVFSFVEAAVLLVAAGLLFLVWARAERRGFHLPGGDGFVISLAGAWAGLLLVWRLFDKPEAGGGAATVGIQWGIFGALLAAGAVVAAGARVRAAHRPEPPNPAAEADWEGPPIPARREGRTGAVVAPPPGGERPPAWEGEPPPEPPRGERPGPRSEPGPAGEAAPPEPPRSDRLF
jgi:hypothetical protein